MSVDKAHAQELRRSGLTLRVIADRFGVSRERIRQITEPVRRSCVTCGEELPAGSHSNRRYRGRSCKPQQYAMCRCGQPMSTNVERCWECRLAEEEKARAARYDQLTDLWAEGLSMVEIADRMGTTKNALGGWLVCARGAGWDLPLRRARTRKSEGLTKGQAREQFIQAIRTSKIRRPARCEQCGVTGHIQGHHEDYSRPLYVIWLCRDCHSAHHVAERQTA